MRYFLAIFGVCVAAVVGILGVRGSHSRKGAWSSALPTPKGEPASPCIAFRMTPV